MIRVSFPLPGQIYAALAWAALQTTPAFAAAEPPKSLETVIARYVEWRGGDRFRALQSLEETGRVRMAGLSGTYRTLTNAKGHTFQTVDLGVIQQTAVADGSGGWSLSVSGQVESRPTAEAADSVRESLLGYAGVLTGMAGAISTLRADESDEGRSWSVVRVTFGDDDRYDIFIDASSGELHGFRAVQDRQSRFIRYDKWRIVDGVRMPFLMQQTGLVESDKATFEAEAVRLNVTPPADWLVRPAGRSLVEFASGDRTDWIPFEFFAGTRIFIPVKVNGVPTVALFDTGAQTSVLDAAFATETKITASGALSARGTVGTQEAALARATVEIGNLTMKDLNVAVIPIAGMGSAIGHELPMILGKELLGDVVADIDFAARRLAFVRASNFRPSETLREVPLQTISGGLRAVKVSVEGGAPVAAQFDLGNGGPLILFASHWTSMDLGKRRRSELLAGGIGGARPETYLTINRLEIAGFEFKNVPTALAAPGASAVDSDRVLANVGMPVWSRFRLAVDFVHDRLFLAPDPPDATTRAFDKDRTGLNVVTGPDRLKVMFVSPGSPAERSGWRVGDTIATIDGLPPATDKRWRKLPSGVVLTFEGADSDGQPYVRSLVLEEYF